METLTFVFEDALFLGLFDSWNLMPYSSSSLIL